MKKEAELKKKQILELTAPVVLQLYEEFIDDIFDLSDSDDGIESPTTVLENLYSDYLGEHREKVRQALSMSMSSLDQSKLIRLKKGNTQRKE